MGKTASILNDTAAGPQVVRIQIVIIQKRICNYHFKFCMCWFVHIRKICKLCKPPAPPAARAAGYSLATDTI